MKHWQHLIRGVHMGFMDIKRGFAYGNDFPSFFHRLFLLLLLHYAQITYEYRDTRMSKDLERNMKYFSRH